jgi:hypothetical protein
MPGLDGLQNLNLYDRVQIDNVADVDPVQERGQGGSVPAGPLNSLAELGPDLPRGSGRRKLDIVNGSVIWRPGVQMNRKDHLGVKKQKGACTLSPKAFSSHPNILHHTLRLCWDENLIEIEISVKHCSGKMKTYRHSASLRTKIELEKLD